MEQAFGADFSGVRVHTDSEADVLNQQLSAKAFTTDQDIFFRQGEYSPRMNSGQKMIAHELAHVVQQTGQMTTAPGGQPLESKRTHASDNHKIVQRRVAYAPTVKGRKLDWIVLKSIQFVKNLVRGPVKEWDEANFNEMRKNEALGIAGHGTPSGKVGYKEKQDIIYDLFKGPKKLEEQPKEIVITSCHAGEGKPDETLVGAIHNELELKAGLSTRHTTKH